MRDGKLFGGGALKGRGRLTEDKLLRLQHMAKGGQQLLLERLVLALEVKLGTGRTAAGTGGLAESGTQLGYQRTGARCPKLDFASAAVVGGCGGVEKAAEPRYC